MINDKIFSLVSDNDYTKRYKVKKIDFINLFKLREVREIIIKISSFQIDKALVDKYLNLIIETKVNQLPNKNLTIIILPEERTFKLYNYEEYYRLNYIKNTLEQNNISVLDLSSKYKKNITF